MTEQVAIPIEDLMDADLDNIADLAGFEIPPKGHYKLSISLEQKTVNDKPAISANATVLETLELADANETKCKEGTKFNVLFMMDNQWGQGAFKKFVMPIAKHLGVSKVSETIKACQNITVAATLKHRGNKEDKDKPAEEKRWYADLQNVEVL